MIYYSTINKNQREKKSNIKLKISIFTQIEIKKDNGKRIKRSD